MSTPESQVIYSSNAVVIRRLVVSEMSNNIYLLTSKPTGAQVLIDAADNASAISAMLETAADQDVDPGVEAAGVVAIITTHSHWDHVRALAEMKEATGARTYASVEDAPEIPVPTEEHLEHGQEAVFGDIPLRVIALRGHTPGSLALVYAPESERDGRDDAPIIFSADSLFPGGVGNTWNDSTRFNQLLDDVESRLFDVYPDASPVYPGHGDPTTIGAERPSLPQWRERGW
ncbi:MBL fold metallo-hydrolase [Micrococcoides hystricis]|uniref:MBL fold metallo-hydrolase n=1 Tax=Micrococcoides hystricis TaxID=1572761 RepID=A0ABV6P8J3_9MICC